jgi:hypothetical protein
LNTVLASSPLQPPVDVQDIVEFGEITLLPSVKVGLYGLNVPLETKAIDAKTEADTHQQSPQLWHTMPFAK